MVNDSMNLKVLLPSRVFAQIAGVKRIVVETAQGNYGLLPNRLDGVAALVPGILTYETEATGETFLAIDQGVLVKAGADVFVSVRNAIGNKELGDLHKAVEQEFLERDERDKDIQSILVKLETGMIRQLQQLKNE